MPKLCPHCVQLVNALTGCGGMLEAGPDHYAMALVRSCRAEGLPLEGVIDFMRHIATAPELEPRVRREPKREAPSELPPFLPVLHDC